MTRKPSVDTSLAQSSRQRPAGGVGVWLWDFMPVLYFIAVFCLLVFDVVMDQPARGWAQGGVTAGLTVLFAVGFQADTRRHDQHLKARRVGELGRGPDPDEGWIGTTGGRLWDHMALFVLLGAVLLLAAQLMDDPARNWTATIVLAVLSVLFVTGMWANHRRRAEQGN